jgi:hypothetical protein
MRAASPTAGFPAFRDAVGVEQVLQLFVQASLHVFVKLVGEEVHVLAVGSPRSGGSSASSARRGASAPARSPGGGRATRAVLPAK